MLHHDDLNHWYPALLLKPDFYRLCAAVSFTVIDGFDIVAIRVEDKGGVVARVIIALAGGAVVFATVSQRGLVEALHHGAVLRLKGQVMAAGEFTQRCRVIGGRYKQFIGPEITLARAA